MCACGLQLQQRRFCDIVTRWFCTTACTHMSFLEAPTADSGKPRSRTFTPSACACRPGALRPCVLTPGVFAGCGLGAGVVRTCVFPEFCRLPDERTLPRLPTLPLRSPPAQTHRECGQTLDSFTAMSILGSAGTTSSHLPGVCGEPRCPRWCCSAAPEWENPEDSALQSVTLTHTHRQTLSSLLLVLPVLIYLSSLIGG